jgi:hypothetical protein
MFPVRIMKYQKVIKIRINSNIEWPDFGRSEILILINKFSLIFVVKTLQPIIYKRNLPLFITYKFIFLEMQFLNWNQQNNL